MTTQEAAVAASETLSDATSPQELLERTKASKELEELQLRTVADLMRALRIQFDYMMSEVDKRLQALGTLMQQAEALHEMMLKDAETELEILKVFQSQIVIVEPVKKAGTQTGTLQEAPRQ